MTAGRRVSDAGGDARRAILGVVVWIVVLLAGYWLVTEWPALSQYAAASLGAMH